MRVPVTFVQMHANLVLNIDIMKRAKYWVACKKKKIKTNRKNISGLKRRIIYDKLDNNELFYGPLESKFKPNSMIFKLFLNN